VFIPHPTGLFSRLSSKSGNFQPHGRGCGLVARPMVTFSLSACAMIYSQTYAFFKYHCIYVLSY